MELSSEIWIREATAHDIVQTIVSLSRSGVWLISRDGLRNITNPSRCEPYPSHAHTTYFIAHYRSIFGVWKRKSKYRGSIAGPWLPHAKSNAARLPAPAALAPFLPLNTTQTTRAAHPPAPARREYFPGERNAQRNAALARCTPARSCEPASIPREKEDACRELPKAQKYQCCLLSGVRIQLQVA